MARASRRKYLEFLAAVADSVSPPLRSVDFGAILQDLIEWGQDQQPELEERTNADRTTVSYVIPENDVIVWRVAPRLKDGAKVEVLPRSSARLPERVKRAFVKHLESLSPGTDLEPDRRFMIPLHNLLPPKSRKQFLAVLDEALSAAHTFASDE